MNKFNLLKLLKPYINTTRHSERSEESSITRYKTGNVIASVAWQSRHYVRNSFGKLAYGKGLIWILRYAQNDGYARKLGFTMAEILLSLTIIGVVAAITLPSLTGNINEKTWNTQRKALYARISQAVSLMPYINGYGIGSTGVQTASIAAKTFVTEGLAKVYKINNICDYEHLSDCGIPTKIKSFKNSTIEPFPNDLNALNPLFADTAHYSILNTKVSAFETANGENIAVFYNPFCKTDIFSNVVNHIYVQPYMCLNFVYDLNGKKGPNTIGKDLGFISVIGSVDKYVVAPAITKLVTTTDTYYAAKANCQSVGRIPNQYEMASIIYNADLVAATIRSSTNKHFWTSSMQGIDFFVFRPDSGTFYLSGSGGAARYACIDR